VKLRIEGLPDEVARAARTVAEVFDVLDESADYPDRAPSKLVRRYLQIQLRSRKDQR